MKLNVGSLPVALLFIGSLLASEGPVIELEAPTGEFQKRDIGLKLSDTAIAAMIIKFGLYISIPNSLV